MTVAGPGNVVGDLFFLLWLTRLKKKEMHKTLSVSYLGSYVRSRGRDRGSARSGSGDKGAGGQDRAPRPRLRSRPPRPRMPLPASRVSLPGAENCGRWSPWPC